MFCLSPLEFTMSTTTTRSRETVPLHSTHTPETNSARWKSVMSSGLTVFGVACAAAYTSRSSDDRAVGITAWVAVAVVGASSMIATAKNYRPSQRDGDDANR